MGTGAPSSLLMITGWEINGIGAIGEGAARSSSSKDDSEALGSQDTRARGDGFDVTGDNGIGTSRGSRSGALDDIGWGRTVGDGK